MLPVSKANKQFSVAMATFILSIGLFFQLNLAHAAIAVSKSITVGSPSVVPQGDTTRFTVTLTNNNTASAVNNTAFTDNLAAGGMTVGPAGLVSNTCGGTATATPGAGTVTLANGVIPIAPSAATPGSCSIVFEVQSSTPGSRVNTIPAAGVTGNDGAAQSNGSPAAQNFTVTALNPPVVAKSFTPSTVIEDDPASTSLLRITITNPNASTTLPLTTVTDNLPAGLQVAATPSPTIVCTGTGASNGTFAPTAGATTLTIVGGVIGQSGTCAVTVNVVGTASGATGSQTLTNTINPAQVINARGLVPASPASAGLTVRSPIRVGKSFTPNPIGAGQQATLTITLFNDSSVANTVTTFDDSPIGAPAGLVATAAPTTTCAGGTVTRISANTGVRLTGGALPANGSCTITVPFTGTLPTPGLPQTFTDAVAANAVGNTGGFVSQATSATVVVNDELTASKSVNPANVAPGNPMTYSVTVNNFTGVAQNNVTFTDNLPSGIIALASPAPTVTGSAGCSLVSTTLVTGSTAPQFVFNMPSGAVPSPSSCVITFTAELPAGAAIGSVPSNVIPANAICAGTVCNAGPASVRVTTIPTAALTKSFSPTSLSEGGITTLTVSFTNNSANPLTIVSLTDFFTIDGTAGGAPLGLQIASPANVSTTCSGTPTLTAVTGTNSVRIQNAVIPARAGGGAGAPGTCTLSVNVTGPAGNYNNIIPANSLQASGVVARAPNVPVTYATPANANLAFAPAITASKSFSPNAVQVGGKTQLRIRLGNVGNSTLNNVSVIDPLPAADMTIATPANASTTCPGSPVITAVSGSSSLSLTGVQLIPNLSCDLLVDVVSTSPATSVNTIPIGNVTADGGVRNTAPVSASLTKSAGSIIASKNISPNNIRAPGNPSTLTISLFNNGGLPLTNVSLTDHFRVGGTAGGALNGMRVETAPNVVTNNCPGISVSAIPEGNRIDISGLNLAAGATCDVSVDVTSISVGTVQNTIPVGAVTSSEGVTNATLSVSSLAILAQLNAEKSFTPRTIVPGARSRLRITFINPLGSPVSNLSITDNLPSGVTVPAGSNPFTNCVGATVSSPTATQIQVNGGILPRATGGISTTCYAEIDVTASTIGNYANLIPPGGLTGVTGGATISNNEPITDTLTVLAPVTIAKSFSASPVRIGQVSRLTVTITNPNSIALTGGSLTDNLPSGLVNALSPNPATTCGGASVAVSAPVSGTNISITGATIPANGSCTFSADTLSNFEGAYVNTIPANAFNSSQGVRNAEPATATVVVAAPPTITKQFSPVSIPANGVSTLTIVLGNTNSSAITLTAALVDTLPTAPGLVTVASPNGLTTTCPGAVTATVGAGTVTYPSGAQIPTGGCSISVNVTASVIGTYTNFIPSGALQTNVGNNANPATANLTVSPLGFISGRVFRDNSVTPNGTFEAPDVGITGITINLTGTDFGPDGVAGGGDDVAITRTTTTDASGNYSFIGLNAGSYTVTEPTQPAGTVNGITTAGPVNGAAGGTSGTATAVGVTPSAVSNIVLNRTGGGAVSGSPNNNFAEVVLSSISGTVFSDANNNGIQNGADTPLVGVTIELLNGAGAVIFTTVTDGSGNYNFPNLAPGTYSVREPTQPTGTSNGLTIAGVVPNGGTPGTPTGVAVTPSRINNIILPPNTTSTGNNFAEVPGSRTISGSVYIDYDSSGTLNAGDNGLGGQTINLTGTDINGNPVTATTTTNPDGSYSFTGLPEGTYTVSQPSQPTGTTNGTTAAGSTGGTGSNPTGTTSQIVSINLTGANNISANNNFGELPGSAPDLVVSKTHTPSSLSAGSTAGFYTVTPRNIGSLATSGNVQIVDTIPVGLTPTLATGTGWACSIAGQVVTCNSTDVIAANGIGNTIRINVTVDASLQGEVLINNVAISGGGEPPAYTGNNTANDPTPIRESFTPVIGLAKNKPVAEVINANGSVTVAFRLRVQNYGLEPLVNIAISDLVSGAAPRFGTFVAGGAGATLTNGQYTVETAPSIQGACATGTTTPTFTGTGANTQVATVGRLDVNEACEFNVSIRFRPTIPAPVGGYNNSASTTATGEFSGSNTSDVSQNGANPDANGNTNPGDDSVPTPVTYTHTPAIGIAKVLQTGLIVNANGSYTGSFRLVVGNLGNEELDNVVVSDVMNGGSPLFGTFVAGGAGAALAAGQYTIQTAPTFVGACATGSANASFSGNGAGAPSQVATITQLPISGTCTIDFGFRFVPTAGQTYSNQATATGTGAFSGTDANDSSDDGTNPDNDGDNIGNEAGENDPTPVPIPRIGISKEAGVVTNNGDGTYTVPFTLTVTNAGGTALNSVQVTDDLTGTNASGKFGTYVAGLPAAGQYTISVDPATSGAVNGASLTAVAATIFTGSGAGTSLLVPASSTLPNFGAGAASTQLVTFSVRFFPITAGPFNNTAVATGSSPAGGNVTDNSVDGGTPDANGNGDPTDDTSPTPVSLTAQHIGVAKTVSGVIHLGGRRYSIAYSLVVANPSTTVTATNVQVADNLSATFPTAQSITIGSAPTVSACTGTVLNPSATFTGIGVNNLLVGNQNLQPNERCTIQFTTVIDFGSNPLPTPTQNNTAVATTAQTPGGAVIATDLSDNGIVPDTDGDGIANEAGENDPTPVSFAPGNLAAVSGTVYLDANHNRANDDPLSPSVQGFIVEVLNSAGTVVGTTTTDANGNYTVGGLFPSTAGNPATNYTVRFRDPASGNIYGQPQSNDPANPNGTVANGLINSLQLLPGVTTVQQNLPLDPSGVVYNSITRLPVAGATVTLLFNGTGGVGTSAVGGVPVPASCLVGGVNTQVTGPSGFYQFLLINPIPLGCPGDGVYSIQVIAPGGYIPTTSTIIPPTAGPYTPVGPFGGVDPIQVQPGNPTGAQPTTHYYSFNLTLNASPNVVNNHLPLDPILAGAIIAQKTTPLVNVSRGDIVPYTLTFTNTIAGSIPFTNLVDTIPPGFKYKVGSARLNGVSSEPAVNGRTLTWPNQTFGPAPGAGAKITIQILLVVGAGVSDGEYVNSTVAVNSILNTAISNTATATVRVIPDPTFDCSDLIGKVFDDKNANGYQDEGEPGIPNVRVATVNGLLVTSDDLGRFHVTCAMVPSELRGSNFVMKLDERTLPTGYRLTTENPRDVRLTRGKLSKLNFGAAIHRVVRVELTGDAFEANSDTPTTELRQSLSDLISTLQKKPSVIRFSYEIKDEDEKVANSRMKAIRTILEKDWKDKGCCYALMFEEEIFKSGNNKKGGAK